MIGAHESLLLLALLTALLALLVLAAACRLPYPILLVVGGIGLGTIPGLPQVELPPELVLVGLLPPLLYSAAFYTSLRELRSRARPLASLAFGLVLATTCTVALVAHTAVGLPWNVAFVLGAVVAPTDPVAATAVASRVHLHRGVLATLEGEGLINDAAALVAWRFAVAAVVSGSFSLWSASWHLVYSTVGGVAVGVVVGWLIKQVRARTSDAPTQITIALASGYLAYLPAEAIGASAVVAAVTVGVYVGWFTPILTDAQQRLQGAAVWSIVTFVLNGALFALVGLQLRTVLDGLDGHSVLSLVGWASAVAGTVVGTRLAWVFLAANAQWRWLPVLRDPARMPPTGQLLLLGWAGMRGAVTLAAALAIPLTTDAGEPFPGRDLVVFLAFWVIVVTLVVQGMTLPLLARVPGIADEGPSDDDERRARHRATAAAFEKLEELRVRDDVPDVFVERARQTYEQRRDRATARRRAPADEQAQLVAQQATYRTLRRELIDAERQAIFTLEREGGTDPQVLSRVRLELDLEETRLDA